MTARKKGSRKGPRKASRSGKPAGKPRARSTAEARSGRRPRSSESEPAAPRAAPAARRGPAPFPIIGIGGSAGALTPLRELLTALPADSGMAFVIVSHQAPTGPGLLPDILGKATSMPVREITHGIRVEPNRVYIAPPGRYVSIEDGTLHVEGEIERGHAPLPIDFFLRSLAAERGEFAVGIIVSGTGADGALGLASIRAASGIALVQDPESAEFDGMPRSAIAAGAVDLALRMSEIPARLLIRGKQLAETARGSRAAALPPAALDRILAMVRARAGQDFSAYKRGTLRRRVERRMDLHRVRRIQDYVRLLEEDPKEVDALWRDWLIGVSGFFRDPQAFEALAKVGLPTLLANHGEGDPLRVWVPGCATGEEAYSLAILLTEALEHLGKRTPLQIFATDLDPAAIQTARAARYPEGIAADVGSARLRRFFSKDDRHFVVQRSLRDLVVFAVQNVIQDPPFTRIDLISCRNVLIYLTPDAQRALLPVFHYSLNPEGLLLLGSSESLVDFGEDFSVVDRRWKLFRRADGTRRDGPPHWAGRRLPAMRSLAPAANPPNPVAPELGDLLRRRLAERFAPPAVLVDEEGQVQQIHGRTGEYLEPAPGRASLNVVEMAREGLRAPLAATIRQVGRGRVTEAEHTTRVKTNGSWIRVRLRVQRVDAVGLPKRLLLVTLEPLPSATRKGKGENGAPLSGAARDRLRELEQDLHHTREVLHGTIEEIQASNEELASANEEVQSMNEELQSTNEELQTSKEETQSLNEELQTVNDELTRKLELFESANDDLRNLMDSTQIPTIFVDEHLRVKRFTPPARDLIRLIESDVGRSLADLTIRFDYPDFLSDAERVLATLEPIEKEVPAPGGTWYNTRIRPYRSIQGEVEGLVLTFIDVTETKRAERAEVARNLAEAVVDAVSEPLVVLDAGLRVLRANGSFYREFQVTKEDTVGKVIYGVGQEPWNAPEMHRILEQVLSGGESFDKAELEGDFPGVGRRRVLLTARRVAVERGGPPDLLVLAFQAPVGRQDREAHP